MVCDPNFRMTSLCARWPGSTHDRSVWRSSALLHQFETGGIARSEIFINNSCLDLDEVHCINNGIPYPQNYDGYRKRNEIAHMFFFVNN